MSRFWDRLGICASTICLIHCLVTPLILVLFPAFFQYFEHEVIHHVFGALVVISAMMAVYPQCNKHGHKDIIAWALSGVSVILAAIFIGHDIGEAAEHIMTIIGSIFLLIAHFKNIKVRHGKCESDDLSCSKNH